MSTGEGRFLMALEKGKDRRSIAKQQRANKRAADKKKLWSLLGKIGMFSGNPLIAGAAYLGGEFIPDALGVKEKKLKTGYFYGDELKDYNAELSKQRKQRAASVGIGLATNVFGSSVIPEGSTIQSMLGATKEKIIAQSPSLWSKWGAANMPGFGKSAIPKLSSMPQGIDIGERLRRMGFSIPFQTIGNWRS